MKNIEKVGCPLKDVPLFADIGIKGTKCDTKDCLETNGFGKEDKEVFL